ncbi:hypothetical protein [Heterosigma akashiwo virus 01]|uniref:Uncharacterized protein n=1 Tax=Heterosigma akashiwo virus 01 TaxID=97195 RepID=A0A1C9C5K2_HAV01|nr:hypothetical protein D1R72_gp232 [Heterosigma akashiwo virus 01]AOM63563.1 hypothetical protein [Heterosigma akashiwo virus 01]
MEYNQQQINETLNVENVKEKEEIKEESSTITQLNSVLFSILTEMEIIERNNLEKKISSEEKKQSVIDAVKDKVDDNLTVDNISMIIELVISITKGEFNLQTTVISKLVNKLKDCCCLLLSRYG